MLPITIGDSIVGASQTYKKRRRFVGDDLRDKVYSILGNSSICFGVATIRSSEYLFCFIWNSLSWEIR